MLIRYYIICIIVAIVAIAIGQGLRALLPLGASLLMVTSGLQSKHSSITSLSQLITDNIMLLSWIALMLGVIWIGNIVGHSIIIMSIAMTLITVASYCASLVAEYQDGELVRHQSSIFLIVATSVVIIVNLLTNHSISYMLVQYITGIISIFMIIIISIVAFYRRIARIFQLPCPAYLRDEIVLGLLYYVPALTIITILFYSPILAALGVILLYLGYGYILVRLKDYDLRHLNQPELTLDLILKGYKTTHIQQLTQHQRLQQIPVLIESLSNYTKQHIRIILHCIMGGAYLYLTWHILSTGLTLGDFIFYCITFAGYIYINYLYQQQNYININTLAQGFVIGYLTITVMMITIFESDPVGGSIIAIFWVIINALLVTQYHPLKLNQYIAPEQMKRWVRANTAGGSLTTLVALQLPIDAVMKIPVLIVVIAILGFSITQSYLTLKKLNNLN